MAFADTRSLIASLVVGDFLLHPFPRMILEPLLVAELAALGACTGFLAGLTVAQISEFSISSTRAPSITPKRAGWRAARSAG